MARFTLAGIALASMTHQAYGDIFDKIWKEVKKIDDVLEDVTEILNPSSSFDIADLLTNGIFKDVIPTSSENA